MVENVPEPAILQAPKPPTIKETQNDFATTLAWLKERFTQIYSAERLVQGTALTIPMPVYMDIYTVVHDYSTAQLKHNGKPGYPASPDDVYRCLEQNIQICCQQSYGLISQSAQGSTDEHDTQRPPLLQTYNRAWTAFLAMVDQAERLLRFVERHFIRREIDENRKGIYFIRPLHLKIWAEEVLGVDIASGQPIPGKPSDVLSAIQQDHIRHSEDGESVALSQTTVSSLSALGFTLSDDGKLDVLPQPQSPQEKNKAP